MVEIRLYNTRTRSKTRFEPLDPANVRMYVCGPTVYDRAHLGNARPVVMFDVLFRLLRRVYGADHVTYVRNFTDVDDKINARAAKMAEDGDPRPLVGIIRELTDETIGRYHADMDALGALRPTKEPRATEYIEEMKAMIRTLIDGKFAYVVREETNTPPQEYVLADREATLAGHALFDVHKYERYGELSGRSLDDMIAGARVEKAPYKRDPMDFVLWKPSTDDLPGWDSPWGRGRPGWHIECSAMSKALLGETFDIHGGGIDLMFPHHENEIAQSCCANGTNEMARFWMHNEMLQVEGKKMSKSLGNFFTVRDLLDQGIPGEVIRFVFLGTHYGKPMDWTEEKAAQANDELSRWRRHLGPFDLSTNGIGTTIDLVPGVIEALADDLNTAAALKAMRDFERERLRGRDRIETADVAVWGATLGFLGLDGSCSDRSDRTGNLGEGFDRARARSGFAKKIDLARSEKDYATSDALKAQAIDANFDVKITREGAILDEKLTSDYARLDALK